MARSAPMPRTIFHAFNMRFEEITSQVSELAARGFDAVQLSPAQKSSAGPEWWRRYQPKCYGEIEGLGSEGQLKELCERAQDHGVMVVADVVFNHMLVVATRDEWQRAQHDSGFMDHLKRRLESAVGPALDHSDFQWPWRPLGGESWDNDDRYEGWGCGEWSELRDCPKVIDVHCQHLRMLLDCGVRGFRLDAVKHMRPAHVSKYVDFLRTQDEVVYIYGEILSLDLFMHLEYTVSSGISSTDFLLCALLFSAFHQRPIAGAPRGFQAACRAVIQPGHLHLLASLLEVGTLGPQHVAFVRNHDTVFNDPAPCGLGWTAQQAAAATAALLALPGRSVLLLPDDAALAAAAVRFRALMADADSVRVESEQGGTILRVERRCGDRLAGVALVNSADSAQRSTFLLSGLEEVSSELGEVRALTSKVSPELTCLEDLELQPRSARFFVDPEWRSVGIVEEEFGMVEVEFRVPYETKFGQDLHLVGSCEKLGSWDLRKSIPMTWTENNVWVAKVDFEAVAAEPVRYKYLLSIDSELQKYRWEDGNSHMLQLPDTPSSLLQEDLWGRECSASSSLAAPQVPEQLAGA